MNVLLEADRLVSTDRQAIYGHPADDFAKVVALTKPILESNIDPRLKHAIYMIQVKIARLLNTPNHIDSIVDIAGYVKTYHLVLEKLDSPFEQETIEVQIDSEDLLKYLKKLKSTTDKSHPK